MAKTRCAVDNCDRPATHKRVFDLRREGWGEVEVEAHFCCDHLDHFDDETPPFIDLYVAGRIRE